MTGDRLVGRVAELESLRGALAAATEGRPSTVLVSGEAGIGKTRLLDAFAGQARLAGARVLYGASIDLSELAVPYAPLVDALRRLVRQQGEERVRQLVGSVWDQLAWLVADYTGEHHRTGPTSRAQVFAAVLRLLQHVGHESPVVLILEDLQWADASTVDLVSYLTRVMTDEHLLLACSHRAASPEPDPLLALLAEPSFARRVQRIALPRLTRSEVTELLHALDVVDPELVSQGFAWTDGNPFFVEMLAQGWTQQGTDAGPLLPNTVREVMLSKVAQLAPAAQELLSAVAVAGRGVSERLLTEIVDQHAGTLNDGIRACVDHRLLHVDRDRGHDRYQFRHALLREAIYDRLLEFERRELHTRIAAALTSDNGLADDGHASAAVEIAHHWYAAQRWPEAMAAAIRAGDLNTAMLAFPEAQRQYERALHLRDRVPATTADIRRDSLLLAAGEAARWAGNITQAVEYLTAAVDQVDAEADPTRASELYERLGDYRWEAGQAESSVRAYRQAVELSDGQPRSPVRARAQAALAMAALRAGRYRNGLELAMAAARYAESIGADAEHGRALNTAGLAMTLLNRPAEGEPLLRKAVATAMRINHVEDLLRGYANLAVALEHAGRVNEAVDAALEGAAFVQRHDLATSRTGRLLANNAGASMFLLGRWDEAQTLLDGVLQGVASIQETAYLRLTRTEIDVAQGRFDRAADALRQLRDLRITEPRFQQPLYACEAELALWHGEYEHAHAIAIDGIEAVDSGDNVLVKLRQYVLALRTSADAAQIADELISAARRIDPGQSGEAGAITAQCEAEYARGKAADTAQMWRDVATRWQDLGRPYAVAYAHWRQAEADRRHAGGEQRAITAARAALARADALGAKPLVGELEAFLAATGHRPRVTLTPRELQVLRGIAEGLTYKEIAARHGFGASTVSVHAHNLYKKLGVSSGREAVPAARRLKLLNS